MFSLHRFYFLYFGVLGVYIPFFNLYCRDLGFSGMEIGLISMIPPVVRLLFPIPWGLGVDRFGHRERLIRVSYFLAIVALSMLFWVQQFSSLMIVILLYAFFLVPVLPLWEATVLERLEEIQKDYGEVRIWGSLGFIFFTLLMGFILDFQSSAIVIPFIFSLSILNFLFIKGLPISSSVLKAFSRADLLWMRKPKMLIFLSCCALMHLSHGTYYGFFTIYLRDQSHSNIFIGVLWTVGVTVEIAVMQMAGRWIRKFSRERLFPICFAAAVLRWGASALLGGGVPFLFIQALHGMTFGLFHVCAITWIHEHAPKSFRATAQSLFSSATYGVGGMIGFLLNGCLYDLWGAQKLWLMDSAIALVGLGLSIMLSKWVKSSVK